jgi:hypothetical protein
MIERVFPLSAILIASVSIASAVGGGAAEGAGGAARPRDPGKRRHRANNFAVDRLVLTHVHHLEQ